MALEKMQIRFFPNVLKSSESKHILLFEINASFAILYFKGFLHLHSYPIEHHSIIKILILDKLFRGKKRFICRRGKLILPEINLFTFISLLLRIRSRFTCRCRLFFGMTNSFISNETFELTMLNSPLFSLFHLFYDISLSEHTPTDLISIDFFSLFPSLKRTSEA